MIGYEEKLLMALILNTAADAIGQAVNVVSSMAKRDTETIRSEPEAADKVVIDGPELIRALRSLARRYER